MYNNSNGPHRLLAESHSRDFKELLVPPRLVLSLLLIVCPCSTVMNSETPDEIKMASTLRRSHHSASYAHELQFQTRNSQEKHTEILEAQRLRGEAVREAALQALRSEEIRQAQERLDQLREGALLAEKEAKIEEEQRLEHIRIREAENRRKQLPPVPARLPTPPAPAPPAPVPQAASVNQQSSVQTPATSQQPAPKIAPAAQPIVQQRPPTQQDQSNATTQQSLFKPGALVNLAQPAYKSPPLLHTAARLQKYTEIHQQLKQLRKFVADAGKTNPVFKKLTGDMRREITKFMGQIVPIPAEVPGQPKPATPGPNSVQLNAIVQILERARSTIPSPMVDPSSLVVTVPEPVEGAVNNGAQLPSLFLYLLNMFSKAVISQLINAAASPGKLADPLGLITMQVFCRTAFLWRGQKLIDILLAKYRVLCPILFGVCGSDKTEEGRARIGWRRVNGQWAMEQDHFCQMAGLGGGWASMSLRNFKHSISPLPPSNYWQTMGSIVGTAPSDRTSSHYVVLKAMIENFEEKFLVMYGNAAKAALKVALIEFPSQATEVTSSVNALKVMVDLIEKDQHLRL